MLTVRFGRFCALAIATSLFFVQPRIVDAPIANLATLRASSVVENKQTFQTLTLDYEGGPRQPLLKRTEAPDLLDIISAPRTFARPAAEKADDHA